MNEKLHEAIEEGDIEAVKQYLDAGAIEVGEILEANGVEFYEKPTALHHAAKEGHKEIAELLIDNGADVNAKCELGNTPLHSATTKEVAELLIDNGADVNAECAYGNTPLHSATTKEVAKLLIDNGADVNAKNSDDGTPLDWATVGGSKEIVELLIDEGVDVDVKDEDGNTPLHQAANKEIAELFIANGADVNAKDDTGATPLDKVGEVYDWDSPEDKAAKQETADLLRKHGGKTGEELENAEPVAEAPVISIHVAAPSAAELALFGAAREGDIEAVKQHLAAGTDVNAKEEEEGMTPLICAVSKGLKEIAELLIANGADVNATSDDGWTPLHYGITHKFKEIVDLLIAKGADVNAKSHDEIFRGESHEGKTPLDFAIGYGGPDGIGDEHPDLADLLREHDGKTAEELKAAEPVAEVAPPEPATTKVPDISIHKAAEDGNTETVKQHLASGADVNAKDKYGETALVYAIVNGHKEIVELLIKKGANVNAKGANAEVNEGEDGWTPLHYAAREENKEIVELLIEKGADVNAKNDGGATPLDWDYGETADILRKHGGKTGEELKAEGK